MDDYCYTGINTKTCSLLSTYCMTREMFGNSLLGPEVSQQFHGARIIIPVLLPMNSKFLNTPEIAQLLEVSGGSPSGSLAFLPNCGRKLSCIYLLAKSSKWTSKRPCRCGMLMRMIDIWGHGCWADTAKPTHAPSLGSSARAETCLTWHTRISSHGPGPEYRRRQSATQSPFFVKFGL